MQLNPEQQQAARHYTGPCVVTASPGSGKTSVLTARVIYLIKEKSVAPKNILCLTFTNKAANEMRERISDALGLSSSESVWISTFHSLCLAVLRKHGSHVGVQQGFTVYNSDDQLMLLSKIGRMHEFVDATEIKKLANFINTTREDLEQFVSMSLPEADIVHEYLQTLDEFNAIDFSGLLYKCWSLLSQHEKVRQSLLNRFKFVLVDEVQDTNKIQYEIIKLLSLHKNLFLVGDINQAIFSWRGARPENLQIVKSEFADVQSIILPRNYRSTTDILKKAQSLIRNNPGASNVELISVRGGGHSVDFRTYNSAEEEALSVSKTIEVLSGEFKYSDFAVLYRTNFQSKLFEMALRYASIPYRIVGGFSFFDRQEIKVILAYLSVLANPSDSLSFAKAIGLPKRGIGEVALGRVEKLAKDHQISMLSAIDRVDELQISQTAKREIKKFKDVVQECYQDLQDGKNIALVCSNLIQKSGLRDHFVNERTKDVTNRRIDNVDAFLVSISDFATKKPSSTLEEYLNSVKLMTDLDNTKNDDNAVMLSTMHTAKGLEFPVVFVVGAQDGIIPHRFSLTPDKIPEERRLMFVAVTRAKNRLFVSYANSTKQYDNSTGRNFAVKAKPSRFIAEMVGHPCET